MLGQADSMEIVALDNRLPGAVSKRDHGRWIFQDAASLLDDLIRREEIE